MAQIFFSQMQTIVGHWLMCSALAEAYGSYYFKAREIWLHGLVLFFYILLVTVGRSGQKQISKIYGRHKWHKNKRPMGFDDPLTKVLH